MKKWKTVILSLIVAASILLTAGIGVGVLLLSPYKQSHVPEELLKTCAFMKERFFCTFGSAFRTIIPPGVNLDTENNAEAKSLYSAVKRGDISGMSFMFTVESDTWEEWDSDHPTRTINKFDKIFEVSAVTFPAYEATSIQARGLSDALESAKESLESVKTEKRMIENKKKKIKLLLEV